MTEGEKARLVAWSTELRSVHVRLRRALEVSREALATGDPRGTPDRDPLLFCHGFCAALSGHHRSEDHSMIEHLVTGPQRAVERHDPRDVLGPL